jgi:hypothetical protein
LKRHSPALLAVVAAALFVPSAPAAAGPCTLHAPTHHPKAGKRWPVTVKCYTASGKALHATAKYQFIYNGQIVHTAYPSPNADPNSKCSRDGNCRKTPYPFVGRMYDPTFIWPRRAVGFPLKLRVVVRVRNGTTYNLDYAVKVHR